MKYALLLATFAAVGLAAADASAAPATFAPQPTVGATLVEKVRRDCVWVDNKWTYQRGDKRLVCRPDRPSGRGWTWRREGPRFGWYDTGRRAWHNNVW
jgi:hypothetical protein